jgi:hypothetical protein
MATCRKGFIRRHLKKLGRVFGKDSEVRQAQMDSLRWLVFDFIPQLGIQRVILNGTFVTDVLEPNDVDCVLLMGPTTDPESEEFLELEEAGLPFLQVSLVEQKDFDEIVGDVYATSCSGLRRIIWHASKKPRIIPSNGLRACVP